MMLARSTHPEAGPAQAVSQNGGVAQRQLALALAPRHRLDIHHPQQLGQQLHLRPIRQPSEHITVSWLQTPDMEDYD